MKKAILLLGIVLSLNSNTLASECGGKGYTGKDSRYCLKCHSGCPIVHPVNGILVRETECIKVPLGFPLKNRKLICTTCHDMTSNNKDFLRSSKPIKNKMDFCFECHKPACYKKFNPHKIIASNLPKEEKLKACIYCHGVGAKLEAYNSCVGCHTKTPHLGVLEHMLAPREEVEKLVKDKKKVIDITSMKDLDPRLDEATLKLRKSHVILVKGKIECITCHNPHPQIAISTKAMNKVWREIEKRDIEYKLEKLYGIIKEYKINFQGTKLMTQSLRGGQLCQNCHPINLLK
ncbi:cytochrome c3 family protein [Desulfurobacterium thermolithotrophum]|uniref:cytochrome c3 family protein n=1 Tax=Desulfurobacterium thermolithotrophum TaxID=64160 RepID=UPI0013D2DC0D|nr:cytochrome c3 family protein [Desulfurobacterium thermolithotrophum]